MKRGLRALFLFFFANFAIYIMEEQLAYSVKAPKLILERADSNSVLFLFFFLRGFRKFLYGEKPNFVEI